MQRSTYIRRFTAAAAACALFAGAASATPLAFNGRFDADDGRFVYSFHLDTAATMLASTTSWAAGGFAPILTLFGGAGGVVQNAGSSNTCGAGSGAADPLTGACWDAQLGGRLDAGDYVLALTQDSNFAIGASLADGFGLDGMTHYTSQFYLGQDDGPLCTNVDASQRTCAYALSLDLVPVPGAPDGNVPEPAAPALIAAGLLALQTALRRTRRR